MKLKPLLKIIKAKTQEHLKKEISFKVKWKLIRTHFESDGGILLAFINNNKEMCMSILIDKDPRYTDGG